MQLYAYRTRTGLDRWGVLADGGLLTGGQLEREGKLAGAWVWTHLDLGTVLGFADPTWWRRLNKAAHRALAAGARPRPLDARRPGPAFPYPGKIVCVGLNYRSHAAEQGIVPPDRPLLFSKFANTVVADGEPVVRPVGCHALDFEAELGVVIGATARRVSAADAWSHVAGYVVGNDVSARDWQGTKQALGKGERGDGQWLRAKGSDTFYPLGPVFVTADELPSPPALAISSWLVPASGPEAGTAVPWQAANTDDLLFDIPTLIEFVSRSITLDPGDIITTGTPSGVGVFREPPVFLASGDRMRIEIDGIGSVENPIVDAAETD
ncbi:MAG: fumarylacetoacetate hydrolase family protein [Chloroflexota bacterium]|nr:fumarylacetoacetate hydrolase family protein [Chloroflexota bacterium]